MHEDVNINAATINVLRKPCRKKNKNIHIPCKNQFKVWVLVEEQNRKRNHGWNPFKNNNNNNKLHRCNNNQNMARLTKWYRP